ncbi:DNA polymerase III subunit delta, partial [bacterium]|nr:DNA polymerase III subunit delta [bacterium]
MNYLISANSYHIINDEIKKIVENNNYITFNMNLSSVSDLLEEASYYSLDGMNKIIVANNADFFGSKKINEKEMEKLSNYLSNPVKSTMIIFTTLNGFDLRKKITKEIKNMNGLISYDKLDKRSISNYLNEYLKKNNYSCDYKTLNYIIDNSYDNLDIMYNEIDKIMLYYTKPCSFILQDVKKIVGKELDSNNFHFISAVVEKKLSEALRLL